MAVRFFCNYLLTFFALIKKCLGFWYLCKSMVKDGTTFYKSIILTTRYILTISASLLLIYFIMHVA